jgi:colicin import membrane protein
MRAFTVFVLGWVLVTPLAFAQERVELNTITRVQVNGGTVEITGNKKPNFTTFTMTDPPRLVIDVSEAILSQVPEELPVGNGIITGLRTANYGSEASAIARVLIGYEREVETDIQVSGNVLVVKVIEGEGPLVAQAPTRAEEPVQAATGPTVAEAGASAAQAAEAAQVDREAQEKAAAEATAAAKSPEEERRAQQQAEAEEKKRREEAARAEAEEKKQAEAEEKKRKAQEAEEQRLAALEEKKRQQETARAEAEAKKQAEAEEKKRKAREAEERRLAALEEKKRGEEEARAEAEAKKQAEAEEKKREAQEAEERRLAALEEKRHQQETARVASAETPRREEPASPSASSVSGRRKTLEIVGFQQQAGASRVYVRTNEPVRYKVSEGRNEIILELENTQIGKGNNTRALDTSFFDTAVARVDPLVGPDRSVRVSIKLKARVPVQTHQEGNTISLEFPRPPRR